MPLNENFGYIKTLPLLPKNAKTVKKVYIENGRLYGKIMKNMLEEMTETICDLPLGEGENQLSVPFLSVRKDSQELVVHSFFKPLYCLTVQGDKEVEIGDQQFQYGAGDFILVSAELAITGKICNVSEEKPYLGVILEIDPLLVAEVLNDMVRLKPSKKSFQKAVVVQKASVELLDVTKRLLFLEKRSLEEQRILGRLYVKEIIFYLLTSSAGQSLLQMSFAGSRYQKVRDSISAIMRDYSEKLSVEDLADKAHMSASSFHKAFKRVTGMSPIQFQKKVRLTKARDLVVSKAGEISTIAFDVGYESPSQFSREYLRQFGCSPKDDRL